MSPPAHASSPAPGPPAAGPPARRRRSLRTQLAGGLSLAVGLPLAAAEHVLTNIAVAVGRQVDAYLSSHLDVVREVAGHAEAAARLDAPELGQVLSRSHLVHPGFRTMLVADPVGQILMVTPQVDRQGRPLLAGPRFVADREYFQVPTRTGRPHVSGVFLGRGLGTDPIVAVSAPVRLGDGRVGVVEGSLDVSKLPLMEGLVAPAPFDVVILDGADRVVWATPGFGLQPLQEVAAAPLGQALRAAGPALGRYRLGDAEFLIASAALPAGGWHVVIQAGAEEVGRGARRFIRSVLVTLLAGLAVALVLAYTLARRATAPLEALGRSVGAFLSGEPPEPEAIRPGAPREVAELVLGFEELQRRVGRTLSGILPVCAWCRRIRDDEARWHPLERYVEVRFEAEVSHGLCPDCERKLEEPPP